jgi:hypothetical protein
MKRFTYLFLCFQLTFTALYSQHSIQSSVFDAKNGEALELATVRLLNQSDSTLVQGTQTNEKGGFTLSKVKSGNYIIVITNVGYNDMKRSVVVQNKDLILKSFQLTENAKLLKEVEVKGTAAQMVVKNDTLEYNATAFKTQENAVVEDLLKKLPGVEVSSEGKITVNGEEIKNIRVDGKKFFSGDIEQATKNLPADMIEKIQVLDQKSDMAQLTGFEDGDTERIINLTTKPNRRKGVFGNASGAAGADINEDFRYDGSLSLNLMDKDAQTSINAGANNLNISRSTRGRGNWGGGSNAGITTSQNIAVNNNTTISDKFKIGGDAAINHGINVSNTESKRTSYLSDITYDDNSKNNSTNDKYDANIRLEAEIKLDSMNTLIIQPNFNYNMSDNDSRRTYSYLTEKDSTSWGDSHNWGTGSSVSGGLNLIFNHRLSSKKGRSITANVGVNFSQSDDESFNISNKYTDLTTTKIDQKTNNNSDRFSSNFKLSYVEPLWNYKNMVEVAVSASATNTSSEKKQYGIDETGEYSIFNNDYSNTFDNEFYKETAELNYRYSDNNYKITLGLNAEPSQTKNIRTYGNGLEKDTTYGVFNFSPTGRLQYNFGKKEFARIDYRGRTQQPSISQMQPVKNNSDLMNETVGNPSLDPAFTHSLRLMYSRFNDKTFASLNTFLNAEITKDALVSNKIYDNTLKQYNQTVNSNSTPVNFMWNVMYTAPIIQKRLNFSTNTNTRYSTQYSYISRNVDIEDINLDHLLLGELSKTRNYGGSEELSLTFTNDLIELGVRGTIGYSNAQNNLKNTVTEIWDWSGRGNVVIRFPYDFVLSSDIAYSDRAGYSDFDQSEIMWNASLDKTFLKNKATLSLKANDILRQRLNIRQNVGDNYIQYNSYNTLPSYFMVSFSYRLNKFGGRNVGGDFRGGFPGGDGGFRRGGGGGMRDGGWF